MNFINSWKKGNKKNKIDISLRFGTLTILEFYMCFSSMCEKDCKCARFRLMVFNFGVEI
tara:strand:- start:177 stop:353 length:177 start_codon:yes stop_codon:yes gene_type:complete